MTLSGSVWMKCFSVPKILTPSRTITVQPILFLCHRIPFPPNKGDKIRSYNILKFLSQHYEVHLGTFVDDPDDFQYEGVVAEMCASSCLLPLNPKLGKLKSLSGFVKGTALGLPYYANRKMQDWVDMVLAEHKITNVLIFSSTMAQYLFGDRFTHLRRYIDFIDIDSDKWAQYKHKASPVMKLVYGYEARMLFDWEKKIANEFNHSFFVSEKEAGLFKSMVPEASDKISYFNNGVDAESFSPDHSLDSPYTSAEKVIVFTGAMDYWANVDAVTWFANKVLPTLCEKIEDLKFYIVGSKPDEKVKALGVSPYIEVTGFVDDVRPYLSHAEVAVAPMRIARGIQNKVLEAMAMGLVTVASSQGYEGINAVKGRDLIVVDEADEWIDTLGSLFDAGACSAMGQAARELVVENYSWDGSLKALKLYFDGSMGSEKRI